MICYFRGTVNNTGGQPNISSWVEHPVGMHRSVVPHPVGMHRSVDNNDVTTPRIPLGMRPTGGCIPTACNEWGTCIIYRAMHP